MSENIRKMYRNAGLSPPDGKGVHTAAFHRCVIGVKKAIKAGKLSKDTNPYAICMKRLGARKAVKSSHRRS